MPSRGAFPSEMDISECCCRCCCGHCETPGCRSRASRDTQHGSAHCMPQARIQHRITKELLLSDVSPEGCVCACVCVCARAGRGIPTAQSPEKSLRAAPGVLFVLILEGKLPPPTRTPRSRRFPPHAPRLRVRLSPRTAPGHHHPKTRIATAARSPPGGHSGSAAAPVRHGRSRPRT